MRRVEFCIFLLRFKLSKIYLIYKLSVSDGVTISGALYNVTNTPPYVHITSTCLASVFRRNIGNRCFFQIVMKLGRSVLTKFVYKA